MIRFMVENLLCAGQGIFPGFWPEPHGRENIRMATEGRTTVQLSLKNLYRLLTVKDYPVYSTGILRRKNKKGLTLVRFWDEYLS